MQHARKPTSEKKSLGWSIIGVLGELMLTFAALVGLFMFWQLYWTSLEVAPARQARVEAFQEEHPVSSVKIAPARTDAPPSVGEVALGETYGVIHVPVWNDMAMPLAEGTEPWILDQAFAGHYVTTQQVGEVGNFAVAGHRRTYGNNFRYVHTLRPGDEIVVEIDRAYVVYEMDSFEIVDPSQSSVLLPVPNKQGETPTERIMTMTTCDPEFGNSERYIVYSKFKYWTDKSEGIPQALYKEAS